MSNVIDLREWRSKPTSVPHRRCFASTRETLQLLQAFCAIESTLVRGEIIRTAQDAALLGGVRRPPKRSPSFPEQ
jgi:hypothetical protein